MPSLPQGDPFSPVTLALLLAAPAKRCARLFPQVGCAVYLDDRTLAAPSLEQLVAANNDWALIESVTRLKTNHLKTQCWGRNNEAGDVLQNNACPFPVETAVEVLGYVVGHRPHEHPKYLAREEKGRCLALKIAQLPIASHLRVRLAHSLLTSTAAWGKDLRNVEAFHAARARHVRNFRIAVYGVDNRDDLGEETRWHVQGRSSPHLRQLFQLGHGSDLAFVVTTRWLNALARWHLFWRPSALQRRDVERNLAPVMRRVNKWLAKWDWNPFVWGTWTAPPDHLFAIHMSKAERSKAMHRLRQSWRKELFASWFQSRRRDAAVARGCSFAERVTDAWMDKISQLRKRLTDPHELAAATGGMRTAASTKWA